MSKCAIFLHAYYLDQFSPLWRRAKQVGEVIGEDGTDLYLTFDYAQPPASEREVMEGWTFGKVHWRPMFNRGRDIYPFLDCLDSIDRADEQPEIGLKLHTKRRNFPDHTQAKFCSLWQRALLEGLCRKDHVETHLKTLSDRYNGASGVRPFLLTDSMGSNGPFLRWYADVLNLHPGACQGFYAGTMFYFRIAPLLRAIRSYSQFLRQVLFNERVNVSDDHSPTHVHSWERLLGWIIRNNGYSLAAPVDTSSIVTDAFSDPQSRPGWFNEGLAAPAVLGPVWPRFTKPRV